MNLVFSMLAEEITTATKIKWFEVRHLDTIEHQWNAKHIIPI